MPAALDVQTRNNGAKTGKAESGDSITYTFAGAIVPSLVLAGWDGSATLVTVHFTNNAKNDVVSVRSSSTGATLFELGFVSLHGDYTNNADFNSSVMTAAGNTITLVLGGGAGGASPEMAAKIVWTEGGRRSTGPARRRGVLSPFLVAERLKRAVCRADTPR
jgi:hypothetical protein